MQACGNSQAIRPRVPSCPSPQNPAPNREDVLQKFPRTNSIAFESGFSFKALVGNKWIPIAILGDAILQMFFVYAPPMQALFGSEAMPLSTRLCLLLLGGVIFFCLVELEKIIVRLTFPGKE